MFYDLKNYHKIRDIKRLVSDDQKKSAIIRLKKIFCTHIKKVGFFKQQKFSVVYFNITGKYDFLALQLPVDQVVWFIFRSGDTGLEQSGGNISFLQNWSVTIGNLGPALHDSSCRSQFILLSMNFSNFKLVLNIISLMSILSLLELWKVSHNVLMNVLHFKAG